MKTSEMKNLSYSELQQRLAKAREELRILHFQAANKQLKNTGEVAEKRKEVAQILTVINNQRIGQSRPTTENKFLQIEGKK